MKTDVKQSKYGNAHLNLWFKLKLDKKATYSIFRLHLIIHAISCELKSVRLSKILSEIW